MLKVCGPRVLVRPDKIEDTDEAFKSAKRAGLALPEDSKEHRREQNAVVKGEVLSIGDLAFYPPVGDGTAWCEVGDRIYYARHAGKYVVDPENDKEELLMLNDEDVVAVITGEQNA